MAIIGALHKQLAAAKKRITKLEGELHMLRAENGLLGERIASWEKELAKTLPQRG